MWVGSVRSSLCASANEELGTLADKYPLTILGQVHSVHSNKCETSRRIYGARCETDKTASNIQARSFMARPLDKIRKKCSAEGEAKMVQ